jgi:hypothetical protein
MDPTVSVKLSPDRIRDIGAAVGVPTDELCAHLQGSTLLSPEKALQGALQAGSIATRGVNQDHLRSSEAAVLLRHALGVFANLEPALVGDWLVRLRKFDSDFAVERDFYLHAARSRTVVADRLLKDFLDVVTAKCGSQHPVEVQALTGSVQR